MIGKELKKLSRKELVDIIYQLKKNEEEKQAELAAMEAELQDKRIRVSVAGSIAEAAMDITQIFATAQRTADLYLLEISAMKEATERECASLVEDAKKQAEATITEAEARLVQLNSQYLTEYEKYQQLKAEVNRLEEKLAQE